MNPFKANKDGKYRCNFSDVVFEQIKALEVDKPVMVNLHDKSITAFRMNMQNAKLKLGVSVKSKTDIDGNLWVVRVDNETK